MNIYQIIEEEFSAKIKGELYIFDNLKLNSEEIVHYFIQDVTCRFYVRVLNDVIWALDKKNGKKIIDQISSKVVRNPKKVKVNKNENRLKYIDINIEKIIYKNKLINITNIEKIQRRTPYMLYPSYLYILKKNDSQEFNNILDNNDNKPKISKLSCPETSIEDFKSFFLTLSEYERYIDNMQETILPQTLNAFNFYLMNKKSKIQIGVELFNKLEPDLNKYVNLLGINITHGKGNIRVIRQYFEKLMETHMKSVAVKQISKFPSLFYNVMQEIKKDNLSKLRYEDWHFLSRIVWKPLNNLAKEIVKYLEKRLYMSNNKNGEEKFTISELLDNIETLKRMDDFLKTIVDLEINYEDSLNKIELHFLHNPMPFGDPDYSLTYSIINLQLNRNNRTNYKTYKDKLFKFNNNVLNK
ncbi:hypothetical protein VO178_02425 [Lysinibacillus fusiformis]|uniref:hypothetical protein n=1 Tax=Lysinibacillus fusiformis TaxID=28031 RepID=UPI002D78033D|nr:hypothetical protein [Lysinibacillus fusiformis]WRS98590.1 hypothetical protein VO178_02425 [Lysinibacillus fusiformis]